MCISYADAIMACKSPPQYYFIKKINYLYSKLQYTALFCPSKKMIIYYILHILDTL